MRKMLDLNPWPPGETAPPPATTFEWITRARQYVIAQFQRRMPEKINYPLEKESLDE